MYTEGFEQWVKLNKSFTTPITEFNKATTEICKRMSEQNMQIIGENFTRFTNQMKRLSNIKKPEDFINFQRDCISENISASIETIQKLTHLSMENFEEITKLWGVTAAKISEKAVEKAQKYSERER